MPKATDVFCIHCQQYMSRSRERAHRTEHYAPILSPPPRIPSKLRRVFDIDDDVSGEISNMQASQSGQGALNEDTAQADDGADADAIRTAEDAIRDGWNSNGHAASSDTESDPGSTTEDEEAASAFDWDRFGADSGLSSWDKLGEGYEKDAAKIGIYPWQKYEGLIANEALPILAEKLSKLDLAICRAFSYKVQTHTTDEDFHKLPLAFPSISTLPSLEKMRSRVTFLSGFQPKQYDCCVKACCCFVGPHANLSKCPYCQQARYRPDGRPRAKYTYIPFTPRLISLVGNRRMAEQMQYRAQARNPHSKKVTDVFDGSHYRSLCSRHVRLNEKKLPHKFFEDSRDIALGLSADGFSPFKKRKATAWAFILFNYNLPPDIRFHVENILALGVVGPKKPVDPDSFLWPAIQEFLRLLVGVRAFDALTCTIFSLRAFLILFFGDIPAIALLMRMKGHNGILPCRMCKIVGLRVPNSRATTHYVPLNRSRHPEVRADPAAIKEYDPNNLPMRTHDEIRTQAKEVRNTSSNTAAEDLAKLYGIKDVSIFFHLPSIVFPISFPYDFMHLIWENLIPNLILLWTDGFKGLDQGTEAYVLQKAVWEAIGQATAASGSSIPSAYGVRVPNIANDRSYYSAEMWSFWAMYLGPVLLRRRFQRAKYYAHFIRLVTLLNLCLQFEITNDQIEEIRQGFVQWVREYERVYYQNLPDRLPTCPLTIHAVLHIADTIEALGPVWAYWAFPMERFCGTLQRAIQSRRFPYASISRFVSDTAQLSQISNLYDIAAVLALKPTRSLAGAFSHPHYPSCVLLPPRSRDRPTENLVAAIAAALATRFDQDIRTIRNNLKAANIEEWGKVRRVDSDAGDTMHASALVLSRDDTRDATYVRYEMLVDKYTRQARRQPEYELRTFYGQLQHIFVVQFKEPYQDRRLEDHCILLLAAIRTCTLDNPDHQLQGLDIHFYSSEGPLHVIDITSLQCLVGRVRDRNQWAIIDRSGSLARALYTENDV